MKINWSNIFAIVDLTLVLFLTILAIQLVINKLFLEGAIVGLLALMYINRNRLYRLDEEITKLNKDTNDLKTLIRYNEDHLESIEKRFNKISKKIDEHIK